MGNKTLGLENKLKELNKSLKDRFDKLENFEKSVIREKISKIATFENLRKLSTEELSKVGTISCIDGSVNRVGGAFPHYIDLFQSLSKSNNPKYKDLYLHELYTPITSNEADINEDVRGKMLAEVEIQAAIKSIEEQGSKLIIMDGGLIRYQIFANALFQKLVSICEENRIILTGIIKDTKTNIFFSEIYKDEEGYEIYDKDFLYGVLDMGEAIFLPESLNKKWLEGFSSAFLRTSKHPGIIGIDILNSQMEFIKNVANLAYTLTPESSRGVPFLIDMVDKDVKLDDSLVDELIKSYMDKDIYERYYRSERSMRRYWGEIN